jgi:Do/DeqQ family serine protease
MAKESKESKEIYSQTIISPVLVALVSAGVTVGALRAFPNLLDTTNQSAIALPTQTVNSQSVASLPNIINNKTSFVADAVDRVGPAVVRLDTESTVQARVPNNLDDPFFRQFFGNQFPDMPRERQQRGQGSGFIVDNTGVILTNAHVVSGADKVTVTLKDGRKFTGIVKGMDEPSDLAVVKIEGENLPVAPLGNSEAVKVGDWAIAVGNPLGLDNTVTLGIVSTLNRSSAEAGIPDKRIDFIQTDAAINPGNSGGPLLNQNGEVIGINTAIRADGQGIGFAIPIDKAKSIQDRLARGEKIAHPYLGIRMITLNPETAKEINKDPNASITLPEINGVLVMQVVPDSPAAQGGMRRGDVITAIDGKSINTAESLQSAVENTEIGKPIKIQIQRGGQTQELSIAPGELKPMTDS